MTYEKKLHRALGSGASRNAVAHWWAQRVSGVALLFLFLWFVSTFVMLVGAPHAAVVTWMQSPWVAVFLILMAISIFYHGMLGIQTVVEDYVHHEGLKVGILLSVKFASFVFAALAVLSVLRIFLSE